MAQHVAEVINPRLRELGDGFPVRRALPSPHRQMVGPFIFLDQMGPAVLRPDHGMDVRPHPHIGLTTVTYLLRGEILHRDSLGNIQAIRPGEVNWMTAGRGIAHSERTELPSRQTSRSIFGIQAWLALPRAHEEIEPSFLHVGQGSLPLISGEGKWVRVIAGSLFGHHSPVQTLSETLLADIEMDPGSLLALPPVQDELAIYTLEGSLLVEGKVIAAGQLLLLPPGETVTLRTPPSSARFLLLGGETMDGPRHIWWNFVSSRAERIEQAKQDWKAGRFAPVVGDDELIPLPE